MSKTKSMDRQFRYAIGECTAIGESKRSYKGAHEGSTDGLIFSIDYKKDLIKTSQSFSAWVKDNYPGVKLVKDIPAEAWQGFIASKQGLSSEYVEKISSHMNKLQKVSDAVFHTRHADAPTSPIFDGKTEKQRSIPMDEKTLSRVIQEIKDSSKSETWKALELSRLCGARVRESVCLTAGHVHLVDGKYGYGYVVIDKEAGAKHGRYREVSILTADDRAALQELIKGKKPDELIASNKGKPFQPDSINRATDRALKRLGLDDKWKQNKSHAIRKGFAQRCWDRARYATRDSVTTKVSKELAREFVNTQLGHGEKRDSRLLNAYVSNTW